MRGGQLPMDADAKRMPQIKEQLDYLNKSISMLEESNSRMEDRLGSVLCPSCPTIEQEKEKEAQLVELAEVIKGFSRRIHAVRESIDDRMHRVEL